MVRPSPVPAEELLAEAGFLQRLARGLVSDAHGASDLVQDTFVVALEHPPREPGPLRAWLATVAANLARNQRRGQLRRGQREERAARAERVDGDDLALERIELQRVLFDLLLELPAEQRTVLYLRYYEGRTPSAIAAHLAVPLKTVKSRHTRAIAALREKLDARSGGDRQAWMAALAPFAGVSVTIGGLLMKKVVLTAVVALLLVLGWLGRESLKPDTRVALSEHPAPVQLDGATAASEPLSTGARDGARASLTEPVVAKTGALDVHLSWSDGKPAAGVGLEIVCESDPAPRTELFRGFTDEQGVARFPELFAGKVQLVPDLRERFEAEVEAGTTRTIEHTFPVGIEVRGRVVDPQGTAVGTASIWCKGAQVLTADTVRVGACASDGSFRLRDVSSDAVIGARAPGFRASNCPRVDQIAAGPSGAREVELRLGARGGVVRGQVFDADGKPLEHALVVAGPRGGWITGGMVGEAPFPGTVVTDEQGRFESAEDLEPGKQPIHATARGYPVWKGSVDVVAGSTAFVEIRLERAARIEGLVLGIDGKPAAGVKLVASHEDRGGWHHDMFPASEAVSDDAGRFVLEGIAPGPCEVNASDYNRPAIGRGLTEVACSAGATSPCEVRLERGNTISGRVQDKDGVGLAGWRVYSDSSGALRQWYPRQARTASDGSFTLLNLGDGEHDLLVRSPEFEVAARARANRIPVGTQDVVLVVADASATNGTVRARVVDPTGRSIEDVQVTLWRTNQNMGRFLHPDSTTAVVEAKTMPGRYRLQLARGNRTVYFSAEFLVEDGQLTDVGDLTAGKPGRVEVRITGQAQGLERIMLSLEGSARTQSGRLESRDGVWYSDELAAGRWFVSWHEPSILLRGAEVEVPAGETAHVELVAERAVPVRISFENPGGGDVTIETRDASGKTLSLQRLGLWQKSKTSDYSVGMPPGQGSIEVRTLEGLVGRVDLDVNASLPMPVEIPLH